MNNKELQEIKERLSQYGPGKVLRYDSKIGLSGALEEHLSQVVKDAKSLVSTIEAQAKENEQLKQSIQNVKTKLDSEITSPESEWGKGLNDGIYMAKELLKEFSGNEHQ